MNPTDPTSQPPAVTGLEAPAPAQQGADRTAIIEKYNQTYFGTPDPTAAPVAEPVATPDPVAAPTVQAPDMALAMQTLLSEVASLRAKIDAPPPTPAVTSEPEDWLKLLADGKKSDGELALAKVLGPNIEQRAVNQALAIMESKLAINEFVTEVRTKNPDLAPMEPYIALAADARIRQAQASGKVQSPADYVKVYKEAITAEIESARTLSRTFQGIGKTAATQRIADVVASPTLRPNAVNLQREAPAPAGEAQPETASDYLATRRANHARISGMAQTN